MSILAIAPWTGRGFLVTLLQARLENFITSHRRVNLQHQRSTWFHRYDGDQNAVPCAVPLLLPTPLLCKPHLA